MHVVLAVGRVAFEVDVAVILHVFGHLADGEQLFDHLTSELVLAGHLDGLVVQIEVVLVDDELHAGQLLHLAQFLHAELGLGHATADEQVEHLGLVLADASYTLSGMSVLTLRSSALRMSSRATSMATLPPPITATFSAVSGHSRAPVG